MVVVSAKVGVVKQICDRLQENRAQRGPDENLQTPWQADIKLSKFYRRSLSHSRYISPNRSLH